jgi:hypothetical protein
MMAVTTVRPNLYQLGVEIGGSPSFHMVGPDSDGIYTITSSVDEATLRAALDAHTPDPAIVPEPDPDPEPEPDLAARIAELEALLTLLLLGDTP